MRAGYLFLSILIVVGLSVCQQESSSTSKMTEPQSTMPSGQPDAAEPEVAKQVDKAGDGTTEAIKDIVGEARKEVAVIEKVNADKAVVEEAKPATVIEKASGDPLQGAKVARKCGACHTFDQGGKNRTGPNLFGVFGRIKGAAAGFRYGSYLKAQNAAWEVWNEVSLRSWHVNSKAVAKAGGGSSKMPAQKITGTKADDLIAYLKSLK